MLPTILHLVISVFRELTPAGIDKSPACLQAGEHVLKTIFKMANVRGSEAHAQWVTHLRSALFSVIKQSQGHFFSVLCHLANVKKAFMATSQNNLYCYINIIW